MIKCSRCGVEKPKECFPMRTSRGKKIVRKWCKVCEHNYRVEWENDLARKHRVESFGKTPVKSASVKAYCASEHGKQIRRANHLKRVYGLTLEAYGAMLKKQNGVCAICFKKGLSGQNMHVDHDHMTGKIRGLLCVKCNRAISLLDDSAEVMLRAYKYILTVGAGA